MLLDRIGVVKLNWDKKNICWDDVRQRQEVSSTGIEMIGATGGAGKESLG